MRILETDPEPRRSGRGKYVILVLIVLLALGGLGYWFLGRAPEVERRPAPEPEPRPPVVEEREEPEPDVREELPSTGALSVAANVDGATVYLDGERVGEAPYQDEDIAIGRYEIKVEKEGYQPYVRNVRIRPGDRAELRASLDLLPPSLRVESDVPGASVFIDRNYIGTTPVEIKDVEPGEHQLTVSAEGYDMYAETIQVDETGHRDIRVSFKTVDLNESIAVVHKHTFGSCEGTLIADNNGLRYETDNENDAFAAPFAELEQFEIDYMDKNLNVNVRNGRNYNFEPASGNPDDLFVFHKNVQEFLERM